MHVLRRILITVSIAGIAVPATAQMGGYEGEQFVAAIRKGDGAEAMKLLKEKPTLVDARDLNGTTALIAAIENRDIEWAGYLLQQGADPNKPLRSGDTPLIVASRLGLQEVAGWLIGLGARVDDSNRMGETALIVAVQQRRLPVVRTLLEAGADPDKADSAAGYTARDYAKRNSRSPEILRAIEAKKPAP